MTDDSQLVESGLPCPSCPSSDAYAVYDDGHGFCFSCSTYVPADGEQQQPEKPAANGKARGKHAPLITDGEYAPLTKRKISVETCEKWKYQIGRYNGKPVQIANYMRDGRIVAQKVRFPPKPDGKKDMIVTGDGKSLGLYGQWLWRDEGKMVVVTEGEIDALSVSQMQGNKWPVVSVPKGAPNARKDMAEQLEWLSGFDKVVICFDMDEPGRKAAKECAALLPPGKAYIASLPLKDANDMLVAGRGKELLDALWGAKEFRPDGIVTVAELKEEILKPVEWGVPWPWPKLTELTYGRRPREVYTLGAGTSSGKTDVFTQIIEQTIFEIGEPCGVFYLEQHPVETMKRIAGKHAHQQFHIPDAGWTQDQLVRAVDDLEEKGMLYLNNHFGSTEWDAIRERMNYLVAARGVKHLFLDHLTALASHAEDERRFLDGLMEEIASLAQRWDASVYVVSHLATPEGKPHEEGGRVMARHFRGSRAIQQWSHYMFGLERDQQAEDDVARTTTTFRVLKDRYTGRANGQTFYLRYDQDTGMLNEADPPPQKGGKDYGFKEQINHDDGGVF